MPVFRVSVDWEVCGVAKVEANSLEEAIKKVQDEDFPLPTDFDYIEDSFKVNQEMTEFFAEEDIVACSLCGKKIRKDDAYYIAQEGDKLRPYCYECEKISEFWACRWLCE